MFYGVMLKSTESYQLNRVIMYECTVDAWGVTKAHGRFFPTPTGKK